MDYLQKTEKIVLLVCVIMYNLKFRARELPFKEEVYYPEDNEDGFPVYFIPKPLARIILVAHPDRFRLYKSKSIDVTYPDPGTGANTHKKIHPWIYTKSQHMVGLDKENNEEIYEWRYNWREDPKNYSVREEIKTQAKDIAEKTIEAVSPPELKPETAKETVTVVDTPPEPPEKEEEIKVEASFESLTTLRDRAKTLMGDDKEKTAYKLMREKVGSKGPIPKKVDLPAAIDFYNNLIEGHNAT